MEKSFKERRKYIRIYRNFILTYQQKGQSTAIHEVTQINNISQGGMNFSSTHPLKAGSVIMVNLKTPFIADHIQLEGTVLECKDKITGLIYEIRLQFQETPAQVIDVLEKIEVYGKAAGEG